MHKVSIVVRTSTRYMFLDRAIKDILNQTFKEWKMILINDGGDQCKIQDLIKANKLEEEQYILIHNDNNIGLHKTINLGVKAVDTEYVIVHDDDDTWKPEFLQRTIEYLENNEGCYGLITHSDKVYEKVKDNQIKVVKVRPFNNQLKGVISIYDMLKNNLYSPISFIYRAKVYSEIGYFDETLEVLEDWEFNLRFLAKYDIHVLEESLANYHIRVADSNLQDSFKNTVTSKKLIHEKYDTIIRNRYLRQDLETRQVGLGVMMNILKWSDGKVIKMIKRYLRR